MSSIKNLFNSLVAVVAGSFASAAYAGTLAELGSTGFSDDGAYFAFEQYGIQDGSGFAYASFTIVDVKTDSWVPGTPVKVRLDDETQPGTQRCSETGVRAAGAIWRKILQWRSRGA